MKNAEQYKLEDALKVGTKIKVGVESSKHCGLTDGQVIDLVEGYFEHDNGLWVEDRMTPSIRNSDDTDWDSIYHLFGNDLEYFLDSKLI